MGMADGPTERIVRVERDGDRVNVVTRDDTGKLRRYFNVRVEGIELAGTEMAPDGRDGDAID